MPHTKLLKITPFLSKEKTIFCIPQRKQYEGLLKFGDNAILLQIVKCAIFFEMLEDESNLFYNQRYKVLLIKNIL